MSRSVPAQGEMAATAVEEVKRRVDALEQEKMKGLSALSGLEEYCSSRITDAELPEVGDRLWSDFRIDVQDVAAAKTKLDEVKENLKSVNTQLETAGKDLAEVRRQAAVTQQVCWRCVCVCVCVSLI